MTDDVATASASTDDPTTARAGEPRPPSQRVDVEGTAAEVDAGSVHVADFASEGSIVDTVPVHISYGIIERFSEGLYSSPNKTFEELVTNSYDAGAETVWVYLSSDLAADGATIVVVDDGESMDINGLKDLWRIGDSRKREVEPPKNRPRPVGKFGIGKLATYVLADNLTYLTHRDGKYLAVTMDYGRVTGNTELLSGIQLALEVVELSRAQALESLHRALTPFAPGRQCRAVATLFDADDAAKDAPSWTAAILTSLKPVAQNGIEVGRLRWVLRTALPLNPGFNLWMNDAPQPPSKASGATSWVFTVGVNEDQLVKNRESPWGPGTPTTIKQEELTLVETEGPDGAHHSRLEKVEKLVPAIKLPHAGLVWGQAHLYEKPLLRGKSGGLGRSHGFFVRVRGRLINLDDEDFSLGPELRHGTLTRFNMEVNADDLDDQVASARESLRESLALTELKNYLLAIFNKARGVSKEQDTGDKMGALSKNGRLADPPPALSQGPLRRMLQRAADGDPSIREALGLGDEDLPEVENALQDGMDLVDKVVLERLDSHEGIMVYDPKRRAAVLNQGHPFVVNYIDSKRVAEPLKLLGLTEILTQAYLLDENVAPDVVARVMRRRDSFLRAITQRYPHSAHIIAQALRDASNDENALEDAVADALELLGYDVLRLGGSGHGTDGVATARLGLRKEPMTDSYAFTYDAKSTANAVGQLLKDEDGKPLYGEDGKRLRAESSPGKIRADTARTSILKVHRQRASAKHELPVEPAFTLLVAPGFQGGQDEEGLINDVCVNDAITAITVQDLATLVELFALQGLNPHDLRTLFDERTPSQTRAWVEARSRAARVPRPPVATLVDCIVRYSEQKRVTSKDALGAYLAAEGHDLRADEIDALVRGLQALAPRSVFTDDRVVALNATPASLYREIRESLDLFDDELVNQYRQTVPADDEKR
ncbi:ATP-binding protein [Micromonospora sp. NPDC049580]|uniref:ATP-binding protein n=1 Tax=Micromonospora sp. NPDC049580 TaxID=3154832 RepID=UPI003412776C